MILTSHDIHRLMGPRWPEIHDRLGVGGEYLHLKRNGPCPLCGGQDRYHYSNRRGRGDWYCRQCKPKGGNGFELLMALNGWDYRETRRRVLEIVGDHDVRMPPPPPMAAEPATPSAWVKRIASEAIAVGDVADVRRYLESRDLWPLPKGCSLRAHPKLSYYDDSKVVGRFPALLAAVRDVRGEVVTLHVTYIENGQKLDRYQPRKILGPMTARTGCASRLVPIGDTLGIGEGVETALSAQKLYGTPTWAALNATLLAKFEPPATVKKLWIYADRDTAGREAAEKLAARMAPLGIMARVRFPADEHNDFNDQLLTEKL